MDLAEAGSTVFSVVASDAAARSWSPIMCGLRSEHPDAAVVIEAWTWTRPGVHMVRRWPNSFRPSLRPGSSCQRSYLFRPLDRRQQRQQQQLWKENSDVVPIPDTTQYHRTQMGAGGTGPQAAQLSEWHRGEMGGMRLASWPWRLASGVIDYGPLWCDAIFSNLHVFTLPRRFADRARGQ